MYKIDDKVIFIYLPGSTCTCGCRSYSRKEATVVGIKRDHDTVYYTIEFPDGFTMENVVARFLDPA